MARVLRFFRTSASAKLQHKIYYENEKRTFCKNYLDCVRDDGVAGGGNPFPEQVGGVRGTHEPCLCISVVREVCRPVPSETTLEESVTIA